MSSSNFIDNIKSSKIIMKILMKYSEYFQEGSYFSYFLLLIKYIPLLIITHEWKFSENFGLFQILGKFCVSNYIDKTSNNFFTFLFFSTILFLNLFAFLIFFFSYNKLKNFETKSKGFKKYMLNSLFILNFLNFSCVQFFYEIIFLMPLKFWSTQKIQNLPGNKNLTATQYIGDFPIRIVSIFITLIFFVYIFIQNFTFNLLNFRPYFIKKTFYAAKINSFNYINILFPLMAIIIPMEKYGGDFDIILVIKLIVRIFFCMYYIKNLFNYSEKILYLEFFISSFCFTSCLVEFFFLKDFLEQNETNSFLYVNYFFYTKIFLQVLFALIFCLLMKFLERNFSSNFFSSIKSNKFYNFYNKVFELTNSLMQKGVEKKSDELCLISQKMNMHIETCNISDCLCSEYKNLLENTKSNPIEKRFNENILIDIILNLLNKNLKKLIKQMKYSNSEEYCKYLTLQTIYMLYFKKHYAKCFFNIEKIGQQEFYRKNLFFRVQIFFLKYEVIIDFIKFNKNSNNTIFKKMRISYEKYHKYKNLEISFLRILENYKNLISLFYAKNISFSEYYFHIEKFCNEIENANKKMKTILSNDDEHSSIHIRKIDYITNFLNGENKLIPYHKLSQFLNKTHDDKSDKLIVKHTTKKEFIIDYISSNLAEQLGLKTKDFIGFDFHRFMMTTQFAEIHYQHIVNHIKHNKLMIRNKEIFLPDKDGYVQNFEVDGSILITLSGEILVFVEVFSIDNTLKEKNISFISCDEEGEILALSSAFTDNFCIDINVKNIVQPNLFKGILTIDKNKLKFDNEVAEINYPYKKMVKNIRTVDYSKLWDYKPSLYFSFLEKMNIDKFSNEEAIDLKIRITRRNLQQKFYFYDFKISLVFNGNPEDSKNLSYLLSHAYTRGHTNVSGPNTTGNPFKSLNNINKETDKGNPLLKMIKERSNVAKSIKKVKNLSIFLKTLAGRTMTEKENININEIIKEKKIFKKMKSKLNEIEDENKAETFKHSNSFYRMIFFIIFILGFFIFLSNYTKSILFQVELFAKMKLNFYSLQQGNYNIINSIFSLNLISGGVLPKKIEMKNLNYSSILDNSLEYHLNILERRRDTYQENFAKIHDYYLFLNSYLMQQVGIFFDKENTIQRLNFDWKYLETKEKTYEILEYEYRGISKIISNRKEWENSFASFKSDSDSEKNSNKKTSKAPISINKKANVVKYLLYDEGKFEARENYDISSSEKYIEKKEKNSPPNLGDVEIFYFLENSLFGLRNVYFDIKKKLNILFDECLGLYKSRLLMIFMIISVVIILFFIVEGILFFNNYKKVFLDYFILFNIIKNFIDELYLKIELLEELFIDFTFNNRNKYSKLSSNQKFLHKKLQKNDTLKENYNEMKSRINFLTDKNNEKKLEDFPIKNFGLLDYDEKASLRNHNITPVNNNEDNFELNKLAIFNGETGGNNNTNNPNEHHKKIGFIGEITNEIKNNENLIKEDKENAENKLNKKATGKNFSKMNSIKSYGNKNSQTPSLQIQLNGENIRELNNALANAHNGNLEFHGHGMPINLNNNNNLGNGFDGAVDYSPLNTENNNKLNTEEYFLSKKAGNLNINNPEELSRKKTTNNNTRNKLKNNKSGKQKLVSYNDKEKGDNKENTVNNTFNKTDANLISKKTEEEEPDFQMHDETGNKKSRSFFIMYSIFWILLLLIIVLIILNIDNTSQIFEKILLFDSTAVIFYRRILLFSELLLIYQMSIFKKDSQFILENPNLDRKSSLLLDEIYNSHEINLKHFSDLKNSPDPVSLKLKELEETLETNGNFCDFLSENYYKDYKGANKESLKQKYFSYCENTSQMFFSVGFSEASLNLYNYMRSQNAQLIDYFKDIRELNGDFTKDKVKYYLNDFYYLFCFVNHDRIITDLISILDKIIETEEHDFLVSLEEFHEFIFYLLYFTIIALGIFTIYMTKFLIYDSFMLINRVTEIVENSIKFTDLQDK